MGFIKKFINKIKNFFRPRLVAGQHIEKIDVESEQNIKEINSSKKSIENKEQFFKMYQAYKEGKIKEENLLITDLIEIELMLIEEDSMLNDRIIKEKEKIINQTDLIKELKTKISNLKNAI